MKFRSFLKKELKDKEFAKEYHKGLKRLRKKIEKESMPIDKYKKTTVSELKKKLDKLWKIAVLRRDRYCKACELEGIQKLSEHAHHIVHRSQSIRGKWDVRNGIGLCSRHHYLLHLHKLPLDFHMKLMVEAFGSFEDFSRHIADMKELARFKKHDLIEMIKNFERGQDV